MTERTDRQVFRDLYRKCRDLIADMRATLDQYKATIEDETFAEHIAETIDFEERLLNTAARRKSESIGYRISGLHFRVDWLGHRKEHLLELCRLGKYPEYKHEPVAKDYWTIGGHIRREIEYGYLARDEDGVYRMTETGRHHLIHEVMFFLKDNFPSYPHFDLWTLHGIEDNLETLEEDMITLPGYYQDRFYWNRVRNAILVELTDDQLACLRMKRPKPLKVKENVPVWMKTLIPAALDESANDNIESDAGVIALTYKLRHLTPPDIMSKVYDVVKNHSR